MQTNYIIKSLLISALFGLLGLALIEWFANPLMQITYGEQYAQASTLLPILGWMIVLLIPNSVLTQTALALNLEKSYALTATLAAAANLSLNILFIPEYGTVASAYCSVAAEFILLIGLSVAILKKQKER